MCNLLCNTAKDEPTGKTNAHFLKARDVHPTKDHAKLLIYK
jgi:hypothetical protein